MDCSEPLRNRFILGLGRLGDITFFWPVFARLRMFIFKVRMEMEGL